MSKVLELKRFGQKVGVSSPTQDSELMKLRELIAQVETLIIPTNAPLSSTEPISLERARVKGYVRRG